jgi:hypothetical protein
MTAYSAGLSPYSVAVSAMVLEDATLMAGF